MRLAFILVWLALSVPAQSWAAPPGLITQCSKVEYRQQHLAQCDQQQAPALGAGSGGGGGGSGLLGGILHTIGGLL